MNAKKIWVYFLLLFILTIPSFASLLYPGYFSMHDDQHIVRLYLLDKGIHQGHLYPRWVDGLGFNFGYPLFNFYPPLVYYVAELFHLVGFSLIWSVKLTFVTGFILAGFGMFIFLKRLVGKLPALFGAVLYNYFFYHAITAYVRGALAEFFTMAIIPFVLYSLDSLFRKASLKNSIYFGLFFALLILTHPLIAFPFVIYLSLFFLFYFFISKDRKHFLLFAIIGVVLALGISSFFWMPSLFEKKYTMVDDILTRELANYKLHYVQPSQFWYSPWGYGGSVDGTGDGITFQLGKIHIAALLFSLLTYLYFLTKKLKKEINFDYYLFFAFLVIFSLFIMIPGSSFIWDNVKYLWYLQFPWRFFTFANIFISSSSALGLFFLLKIVNNKQNLSRLVKPSIVFLCLFVVYKYSVYFKPQKYFNTNDVDRTTFEEISWRISNSSFEFSPKGVKTKKSKLNTSIFDIDRNDVTEKTYKVLSGKAEVRVSKNLSQLKEFEISAKTPLEFQLNTFSFPGWKAFIIGEDQKSKELGIVTSDDYKLINVKLGAGHYIVKFVFTNTIIRTVSEILTLITFLFITFSVIKLRSKLQ